MNDFQGKTVLVTGGGSGIGRACALAFARKGANVIVADVNASSADETLGAISRLGESRHRDNALPIPLAFRLVFDVSDEAAVISSVDTLTSTPVDILVNSAGLGVTQAFLDTPIETLDRLFSVNFRGTFLCSQQIARHMLEHGTPGCIINVGSASGARGNAGRAAYGATKAAVANLTQVMAVELAAHGIRVNAVAPGPIETPLVDTAHTPAVREAWMRELSISRYGQPEDVANAVLFLANSRSAYITGHVLYVDGGFQAMGISAC